MGGKKPGTGALAKGDGRAPSAGREQGALAAGAGAPSARGGAGGPGAWVGVGVHHLAGAREERGDDGTLENRGSPQAVLLAPAPSCRGETWCGVRCVPQAKPLRPCCCRTRCRLPPPPPGQEDPAIPSHTQCVSPLAGTVMGREVRPAAWGPESSTCSTQHRHPAVLRCLGASRDPPGLRD